MLNSHDKASHARSTSAKPSKAPAVDSSEELQAILVEAKECGVVLAEGVLLTALAGVYRSLFSSDLNLDMEAGAAFLEIVYTRYETARNFYESYEVD